MYLKYSLNVKLSSQGTKLEITPANFSNSYVNKRKSIHKKYSTLTTKTRWQRYLKIVMINYTNHIPISYVPHIYVQLNTKQICENCTGLNVHVPILLAAQSKA
jgi:hypothetical protein